jgi:hypothetical protein
MLQRIQHSRFSKILSIVLIYSLLLPLFFTPHRTYAQSGPNQTETAGFTLGSTSGMVDEFTGDFSYSIPLLDVDGYPITISYNSNVNMFQEASWVGLGWDLSVGAVSRDMRGIPDDFNGSDKIERSIGMKDYETEGKKFGTRFSFGVGSSSGVGGGLGLNLIYGQYMNSYNGKGTTWDFGLGATVNLGDNLSFNSGVGFSVDSQNGIGRNNSIGVGANNFSNGFQLGGQFTASSSFSSRSGLKSTNFSLSHTLSFKDFYFKGEKFTGGGLSYSHGSTYSLGTLTSVPKFDLPRFGENTTEVLTMTGLIKLTAVQLSASMIFSEYYYNDLLTKNRQTINSSAYGYFHLGKGQRANPTEFPMMDFNRERDSEFSEEMVNIPFSAPTYDFFNISAYGIQSSVRGQRMDVGNLQDPYVNVANTGTNKDLELQVGYATPNGLILGFAYSEGDVTANGGSGAWQLGVDNALKWDSGELHGLEKGVFFKSVGEHTPRNMNQWNSFGGSTPIQMQLESNSHGVTGSSVYKGTGGVVVNNSTFLSNNIHDQIRATSVLPLTADNYVTRHPLNNKIYYQNENQWINPIVLEEPRITPLRKGHHISSLEVVSSSGIRYYFDIPVYNISQSDVNFSASGLGGQNFAQTTNSGLIVYSAGDNTVNNQRGRNGFFEKTTTPGYAHSYLLSYLVSSDYYDRTSDGPSVDDIGEYYKFSYTRIYDVTSPYKWRFPYESNTAKLIQGHYSTPFDDVATYSYGEKEVWYPKSIETKNYIVEFHLNDNQNDKRKDGHGVNGENGGIDPSMSVRKLNKIVLYNRNDRLVNGNNAVPIKTITFEYDYSLCKGNPSTISNGNYSESGKLTLKAIRFSGGLSEETLLSPYEFIYELGNNPVHDNPDFSYINVDRWGNYKPNQNMYNNIEYPYSTQNEEDANYFIQAWKLKKIITPSHGSIQVEYEADRFAYTQDKSVMKLIKVLGMTSIQDFNQNGFSNASQTLYNAADKEKPFDILFFELDEPITGTPIERNTKLYDLYFKDKATNIRLKEVFFQFRIKVNPDVPDSYENILGFADIYSANVLDYPGGQVGYILLKDVDIKDKEGSSNYKVNPILKTAWQYARLNIPDVVYGNCNYNWANPSSSDCDYSNDIDAAVAFGKDLNKQLHKKNYCEHFDKNHSFIRLYDPRGYKFGGNARVKSITYSDNWQDMSNNELTSVYVWEYSYSDDRTGVTTGVAAYEPSLGNVVNPFYQWTTYKNEIKQFPDESRFTVEPIGEMLYPAPIVGYQKVSIKFKDISNVTQNTIGKSETEFYTSKDYPTIVRRTAISNSARVKKNNFFTSEEVKIFGLSQGYTIVTNDFHGKQKKSTIYDRDNNVVQSTKYLYSDKNLVNTLDNNGVLATETIATEYDIYSDTRFIQNESNTKTVGGGVQINWYIPWPLFPLPIFNYSTAKTRTGFFTHTLNKHLNQSAVLERVETTYLGSKNSAENLVRDRYSGEVIVSSLNDEFNDKLYSVSYPAHWHYANLQSAYKNQNLIDGNATITNGQLTFSSAPAYDLVPGDILEISNGSTTELGWALTGGSGTFGGAIIKSNGQKFNSGSQIYSVKLHQSGRTNRITETMQTVTTKTNPIQGNNFIFPSNDILSASAVEYDYNYDIPCFVAHDDRISEPGEFEFVPGIGMKINPFRFGLGNIKLIKQLAFQSEREDEVDGIRRDAEITDYKSFYGLNSNGNWYKIYQLNHPDVTVQGDYQKWRELQKIGRFDEYGKAVSAVDPLDVKASVLYGFNKQNKLIPEAQAVNATTNQLVFESFEDHNYQQTSTAPVVAYAHFNFMERGFAGVQIVNGVRHSGENSLRIEPNRFTSVERKYQIPSTCIIEQRISNGEYLPSECDCIQQFSPIPGTYVISAWFKKDLSEESYSNINVSIETPTGIVTFTPSGPIIDGWQRLEAIFEVPNQAGSIIVKLSNNSSVNMYVDDFRIHPLKSIMTTTVYNPQNLLPMATHDENNFTTFYNYDENNQLVRIRVETIEGIRTISEINRGIKKRY